MLAGCRVFLLPAGDLTRQRIRLLSRSVAAHAGQLCASPADGPSHVLADRRYDGAAVSRLANADVPLDALLLDVDWLVRSLREKRRLDEEEYRLADSQPAEPEPAPAPSRKRPRPPSPDPASDGEPSPRAEPQPATETASRPLPRGSWVCATSSKDAASKDEHNGRIIEVLSEMADTYKSTNDKWRAFGYQKAIQALRRLDHEVASREEALRLPGVGSRLAEKIWEIAESGGLGKLQSLREDGRVRALRTFTAVWGVGPATAQAWVQAGLRSLEDVRAGVSLTRQQAAGVRHFHDLQERMPREEALLVVDRVADGVREAVGAGFVVEGCGSLRRGSSTCGDVDVLVTHPDGVSHRRVFPALLRRLEADGFLEEHLVGVEENGHQKKYLGVCRLAPDAKARRIDIIVVPAAEHACARLYFTGSAHFTRSMRHLAKRLGMSLNEHALRAGVVRKDGEKVYDGAPLDCPTEEAVFQHLGIPYREPSERDH